MSNELPEPKFDLYAQWGRVIKGKKENCPVCFKAYELIDNELIQTCFCPQESSICGRHGLNNHGCGS